MSRGLTIAKLQEILQVVHRYMPNCDMVVAGGAPRDVLNGREVKDVDIFLQTDNEDSWQEGSKRLAEAFYSTVKDVEKPTGGYASSTGYQSTTTSARKFRGIKEITCGPGGVPLQLVRLEDQDPRSHVTTFDFGLCQVYVTAHRLKLLPAYNWDRINRRLTYLERNATVKQLIHSADHLRRLMAKYDTGWQFVNCDRLKKYL